MEITEVRIKLVEGQPQEKLKAFCSITIDNQFVIRDLKIIEGAKGLFVAMPSRKLTIRCGRCGAKNQLRSKFCSECGTPVPPERSARSREGRHKLHADIAHPINSECRQVIQSRVLQSYEVELTASRKPGYRPADLDDYDAEVGAAEAGPEERSVPYASDPPAACDSAGDRSEEGSAPVERHATDGWSSARGSGERSSPSRPPAESERKGAVERGVEPDDPPPEDNFGVGIF